MVGEHSCNFDKHHPLFVVAHLNKKLCDNETHTLIFVSTKNNYLHVIAILNQKNTQ